MFRLRIPALSILTASLVLPVLLTHGTQAIAPFDPYADVVVAAMFTSEAQEALGVPDGDTATLSATLGTGIELDMGEGEEGTGDLVLYYSNTMLGSASTRVTFLDASKAELGQETVPLPMTGMSIGTVRVPFDAAPAPYRYVHIASVLTSYSLDAIAADSYRPDSDNDGMPDQWEIDHGLDPLDGSGANGPDGDPDGDGLTNAEERAAGTHPTQADTDGDGLPDGWEHDHGLDPLDGSGDNGAEGDPDGDGLTNAEERTAGTHPKQADTDGDGLPDGWEHDHGLDPLDPHGDNGPDGDPDGDGLTNAEEYRLGRNPSAADNTRYFLPFVADDTN